MQYDDDSETIYGNSQLRALETNSITRDRRCETESPHDAADTKSFWSINSSISLLKITFRHSSRSFRDCFNKVHQQQTFANLCRQAARLEERNKYSTTTCYNRSENINKCCFDSCVFRCWMKR